MYILSIDPGLQYCGFVFVDTNNPGSVLFKSSLKLYEGKRDLFEKCTAIKLIIETLSTYFVEADIILIESQFKGKMREIQIMFCALLQDYSALKFIVHPMQVKKYFRYLTSGYRANKLESVEAAKLLAPCDFAENSKAERVHDMADAYMQALFWGVSKGYISKEFVQPLIDKNATPYTGLVKRQKQNTVRHTDRASDSAESSDTVVTSKQGQ